MIPQSFLRFALLPLPVTCLTLPLHLNSPTLLLLPSPQTNDYNNPPPPPSPDTVNHTLIGTWPVAPITRHLAQDTDMQILRRKPPPLSDRTPEMAVLAGLSVLAAKARSQSSRLATVRDFHAANGPVAFGFHATEDFFFRGRDVARVLDGLWQMTHLYGKAEVFGSLVRAGVHTAYFELRLGKGEGVR